MKFHVFVFALSMLMGFTFGFSLGATAVDNKIQEMQVRGDVLENDLKSCKLGMTESLESASSKLSTHESLTCLSCN